MSDSETNGVAHAQPTCPERKGDRPHCYHTGGHPIQSPSAVLFPSVCCFCAPTYMHIDVLVGNNIPDTDVVAAQMEHGHLVTIKKAPRQGPRIATLGR